ncbi:hypothetical protein ACSVDA_21490 [Cytobacillus sp. Hm23]
MKKIYVVTLLFILGIGFSVYYIDSRYQVENTHESIESSLKDWLNRSQKRQSNPTPIKNPTLIEKFKLDDTSTHIGLFQLENDNIGYVRLIEGLNGKLKIAGAGHGTNDFKYREIETNKGLYAILIGKNPEKKIDNILVNLMFENYNFNVDVPTEELFVRYHKFSETLDTPFPAEYTLFDKNNGVIE